MATSTDALGREAISFQQAGGNLADSKSLAGHFADRLSALEQNLRLARRASDLDLMDEILKAMKEIQNEAEALGFDRSKYPGLYDTHH